MRTYKLHLIRHGLTTGNLEGRYIGHTDLPLCPQGVARLLQLQQNASYPLVERVYSSPLLRCRQTAKLLYPDYNPEIVDDLIECNFGAFEGKTLEQLQADPDFVRWMEDSVQSAPPGGEDTQTFTNRAVGALEQIFTQMMDEQVYQAAVITHGGVMMSMLAAGAFPRRPFTAWKVDDGCGYTIQITPQMWMRDHAFEVYCPLPVPKQDSDWPQQPTESWQTLENQQEE